MIALKQGPRPGTAHVSFVIEPRPEHQTGAIAVVGDFNDWDPAANEFTPGVDGRWRVAVALQTGRRYAFRYLAENGDWFDEPDADDRREDGLGLVNCILDLSADNVVSLLGPADGSGTAAAPRAAAP